MTLRNAWLAAAVYAVASMASAQTVAGELQAPEFTVVVIVRPAIASFNAVVVDYFDLRAMLAEGLPPLRVTDTQADNDSIRQVLAGRIRRARRGAVLGTIFTPAISVEFRRILLSEATPEIVAAIMDDNSGQFAHRINGTYPPGKPLSTMPGRILSVLPALPDGLEYRFIGHHLILHDTRANVIIDRLPCAIECREVVE